MIEKLVSGPEDQTLRFGHATYTARYALKDGTLTAEVALDSGKRDYALEEDSAVRKAMLN